MTVLIEGRTRDVDAGAEVADGDTDDSDEVGANVRRLRPSCSLLSINLLEAPPHGKISSSSAVTKLWVNSWNIIAHCRTY